MGILDGKNSQWERVNRNVKGASDNLSRIGRQDEQGEKKRFSFFGKQGGRE